MKAGAKPTEHRSRQHELAAPMGERRNGWCCHFGSWTTGGGRNSVKRVCIDDHSAILAVRLSMTRRRCRNIVAARFERANFMKPQDGQVQNVGHKLLID
jgi:hypothetical protein